MLFRWQLRGLTFGNDSHSDRGWDHDPSQLILEISWAQFLY